MPRKGQGALFVLRINGKICMAKIAHAVDHSGDFVRKDVRYPAQVVDIYPSGGVNTDTRPQFEQYISSPEVCYCPSYPRRSTDKGGWVNPKIVPNFTYVAINYNLFVGFNAFHYPAAPVNYPSPAFPKPHVAVSPPPRGPTQPHRESNCLSLT